MTTLEKIRAEIADEKIDIDLDIGQEIHYNRAIDDVLAIIDKYAEQEPTDEWQNGYDMAWEEAKVFYEQEPCDDVISREAVVDDFIEWREKLEYTVGEDYSGVHLLNVAIQKIWDMPSVTQKPIECDDVVSRQAIKKLKRHNLVEGQFVSLYDIEQLPPVRPQEQTGHWIRITNGAMKEKYICSKCGRQIEDDGIEGLLPIKYPYCHCGAKMVEPQESEDKE